MQFNKEKSQLEKFKNELYYSVQNISRCDKILASINEFNDYIIENEIIDKSLFEITEKEIVNILLQMVKHESSIRKIFKGKLVTLESGLYNYVLLLQKEECLNDEYNENKPRVDTIALNDSERETQVDSIMNVTVKQSVLQDYHTLPGEKQNDSQENIVIKNFMGWCEQKKYKANTIKGFIYAIRSAQSILNEHGETVEIIFCANKKCIEEIYNLFLEYPDFGHNSNANILYALRVFGMFLSTCQDKCEDEPESEEQRTNSITKEKIEQIYSKCNCSERIRNTLRQFPKLGLYVSQIADACGCSKENVKKILETNPPWVRSVGSRYYYSEIEENWKDILFESDSVDTTLDYTIEEPQDCTYSEQEIRDILCDPEEFIKKRIKKRKM